MFDTYVTIVGNALTAPEWRRTQQSGQLVANFKVASTARRLDRATGRWVDSNSLRVRVNCWRRLAEGVASSVMIGDPVIVTGRLYTRDWLDEEGQHRVMYELEAVAVGHDLSRGRGRFARTKPGTGTSAVEDGSAESRVGNEETVAAPDLRVGPDPDDPLFADDFGDAFGLDPVSALRGGGMTAELVGGRPVGEEDEDDDLDEVDDEQPVARERVPVGV
ncbi:single-stranded DNA-binding protein [Catellatospora tritici]|uniref:single-stranded DNA-binding protein n=1 Tax=Catellatospora tritici TaxID=2851566 RepID=UPI001C2D9FA5|nr:single-stranded DNA-binding protein [Catellatospora tritici]MBV1854160.1 single-stranded DNA-binding protein [Catellatospora tritici]